ETQLQHDANRLASATCDFTFDPDKGNVPCTSSNADTLDLTLPVTSCLTVDFYRSDWPPSVLVGTSMLTIGSAMFAVRLTQTQPCTLEVKFTGSAPAMMPSQRFVLEVHVDSSVTLYVPFTIELKADCDNSSRMCTVQNTS